MLLLFSSGAHSKQTPVGQPGTTMLTLGLAHPTLSLCDGDFNYGKVEIVRHTELVSVLSCTSSDQKARLPGEGMHD
jgi:hypothetical protein